ncbi:MAG: mobilization protein [Ellagibacter isourolithinifaciens]|uniref:plasmid mobilization protein n=1 Tax=Eggerthellaceae TaxID=1643826 RepID=UPI0013655B55|nr:MULTISPECIES: mobilization protein [Eggerthellaceae]MEE1453731.1 mobilization protein [Ellagibacter isourolithinifaciens]NBJ66056.1 mobilization protein [Adlercreutzia caecimuris]NCA33056.1 mobilization protein [Adlercreutzia muris]
MASNDNNRERSKTIAFRVTPEVDEQINLIVAASGMTKQDYITSKLLDMEVTVVPSTYTYTALRDEMREVCKQLNRVRSGCEPSDRLMSLCERLSDIFLGLRRDEAQSEIDNEDDMVKKMGRC